MSTILDLVLLVVVAVVVFIVAIYVSKASKSIGDVKDYSKDPDLDLAYKYTTWAATVSWILIIGIVIAAILVLIFGPELMFVWGGVLIGGLIIILGAIAVSIGILSALAAYDINLSKLSNDPSAHSAYIDCVISSVVSLGVIGTLGIIFIYFFYRKYENDKELAAAQSNLRRIRTEQYVKKLLSENESNVIAE